MRRVWVVGLMAGLLSVCVAAQDASTGTNQPTAPKKHSKRRAKHQAASQSTTAPAPPAPDTPHDPTNATRQQLPGNPEAKPAGPDK